MKTLTVIALTLGLYLGVPVAAHADNRSKNVHCKVLSTTQSVETHQNFGFVRVYRLVTTTVERCRGEVNTVVTYGQWSMVNPLPQ